MRLGLGLAALALVTLLSSGCGPIDTPSIALDLRDGVGPLAQQFDAEKGKHRLLLLLSPA